MMLAKVIGTVVCTVKYPTLQARTLLLIQPVSKDGVARGKPLVAVDAVGAGVTETVYWCRGKEASLAFDTEVPTDASIVGIVDQITTPPEVADAKPEHPSEPKAGSLGTPPAAKASGGRR